MLSKSIYFDRTKDIENLAFKLQEKNYYVISGHKLLILRPTFKKYITDGRILLPVDTVTLLHQGEDIFLKVKLNDWPYFIGIIFLLILINKTKHLDYVSYLKVIGTMSLGYFFLVWIITVFIRNYVKRDIKASMIEKTE